MRSCKSKKKSVEKKYDQQAEKLQSIEKSSAEIETAKNEVQVLQKAAAEIDARLRSVQLELESPRRVTLIEPAS